MLCTRVSSEAQSGRRGDSESATENLKCTDRGQNRELVDVDVIVFGRGAGEWEASRLGAMEAIPCPLVPLQLGHLVIPTKAKSAIMQRPGKVHT